MLLHLIFLTTLLWSCTNNSTTKTVTVEKPSTTILTKESEDPNLLPDTKAMPGGILSLSITREPTGFLTYSNSFSSENEKITKQILLPLLERHPIYDTVRPSLAESWTSLQDGKVLRFKLRENHYWSDGTPITSRDVAFTFNHIILNKDSPGNYMEVFSYKGEITKLVVVNDKTIEFHLPTTLATIPYTLTYLPILPSHKITKEQVSPQNLASLWTTATDLNDIVASGPFYLASYTPGIKIDLKKNPYFFRQDLYGQSLPYVESLEILIVPAASQRVSLFLAKKLDFLEPSPQDFLLLQTRYKNDPSFQLLHGKPAKSSPSVVHIAFNFDAPDKLKAKLFRQEKFRIAMEYLLNRELIIQQVYRNLASTKGTFIVPTNTAFYDANSDAMRRSHNPDLAKKLLDELGIIDTDKDGWRELPNGTPLHLVIHAGTATLTQKEKDIALLFSMELHDVGIKTLIVPLDAATLAEKIKHSNFEVALRSIANSPDPGVRVRVVWEPGQFMYYFHKSTHDSKGRVPNLDAMLPWERRLVELYSEGNITSNIKDRIKIYKEVQQIYAKHLPVIFTVRQDNLYAAQSTLQNIYLNKEGLLVFSTWTVGKRNLLTD